MNSVQAAEAAPFPIAPSGPLRGSIRVPGDKSVSNRAVLFGGLANGATHIRGFLASSDTFAAMEVTRGLGVTVEYSPEEVIVHGRGWAGLSEPLRPLFCAGSGTTMRLATGIVAGLPFYSILDGNAQLSGRTMNRVVVPLRRMGATILGRRGGDLAPLTFQGGNLQGIDYTLPVASAQIKSALLLAGIQASGVTTIHEPEATRDHTEIMLRNMGADLEKPEPGVVQVRRSELSAISIVVPGDISSAAFFLAGGAAVPDSKLTIRGLGVNPTRTGVIDVLRAMGATVEYSDEREEGGEPVADVTISAPSGGLQATRIAGAMIPRLVDEVPVLAVAATQANGVTEVRDARELRVKETDRIATTVAELTKMGAQIEALEDGLRVVGPTKLKAARVDSHGDHRLAMALSIAALLADGTTLIDDFASVDKSFPEFASVLGELGVSLGQ